MRKHLLLVPCFVGLAVVILAFAPGSALWKISGQNPAPTPINTVVPTIQSDSGITYNYDIIATKAPRPAANDAIWPDIHYPLQKDVGQDLVLIHPDGTEETLAQGGTGACFDPVLSYDGTTLFYSFAPVPAGKPIVTSKQGSDIYKMVLATRQVAKLTTQTWEKTQVSNPQYGVFNECPCPLPDGRIVFVSNRQGRVSPKRKQPTTQLYVMDADGSNVECIGSMNVGGALHPTMLQDGRLAWSSEESQGLRGALQWSLWSIWPDGTNWGPVVSHFWNGPAAVDSWHFQAQLGDGNLVALFYYNESMGQLFKLPSNVFLPNHAFGTAHSTASVGSPVDPRNPNLGVNSNGTPGFMNWPFMPYGITGLTPWTNPDDRLAPLSDNTNANSPRVGKFTHPAAAPDNHLLVCYSPGGAHDAANPRSQGTICLLKNGMPTTGPADLRLIKSDPNFNYRQPVAVVPYQRITGLAAPKILPTLANDGTIHPSLPIGTPYGLIGTSSLYKRESYPNGVINGVTASEPDPIAQTTAGRLGAYGSLGTFYGPTRNYNKQGGDDGFYTNDDIHAIRILLLEPTSEGQQPGENNSNATYFSHVSEKVRIAGEFPVRKFPGGTQPTDPDGNPDTSFLAKIPADTPFTFQTLDKNGLQLNHASSWHQLRPGEMRRDCGGCHAHSQSPTDFNQTASALQNYQPWDLTSKPPLITTKDQDQSNQQFDAGNITGVKYGTGPVTVEFVRDVRPILQAKCISCHTQTNATPPGHLVLDDQTIYADPFYKTPVPGDFARLAADTAGKFSFPADLAAGYAPNNASRYVRPLQSRRSLLLWKLYGQRLDGFTNDTAPSCSTPGDTTTATWRGQPYKGDFSICDLDFNGLQCPPATSPQLTEDEKRTISRWVDTGCGIELKPGGYLGDDYRPTLTVQSPARGTNIGLSIIRIGVADYGSGIDPASLSVVADFTVDGSAPGTNLAAFFARGAAGVWQYNLTNPITILARGNIVVSIKDLAGNVSTVTRTFNLKGGGCP